MNKDLVDYFIQQTNERFKTIDEKLDKLIAFKWQIIGGALVVSMAGTLAIEIVLSLLLGGN